MAKKEITEEEIDFLLNPIYVANVRLDAADSIIEKNPEKAMELFYKLSFEKDQFDDFAYGIYPRVIRFRNEKAIELLLNWLVNNVFEEMDNPGNIYDYIIDDLIEDIEIPDDLLIKCLNKTFNEKKNDANFNFSIFDELISKRNLKLESIAENAESRFSDSPTLENSIKLLQHKQKKVIFDIFAFYNKFCDEKKSEISDERSRVIRNQQTIGNLVLAPESQLLSGLTKLEELFIEIMANEFLIRDYRKLIKQQYNNTGFLIAKSLIKNERINDDQDFLQIISSVGNIDDDEVFEEINERIIEKYKEIDDIWDEKNKKKFFDIYSMVSKFYANHTGTSDSEEFIENFIDFVDCKTFEWNYAKQLQNIIDSMYTIANEFHGYNYMVDIYINTNQFKIENYEVVILSYLSYNKDSFNADFKLSHYKIKTKEKKMQKQF